LRELSEAIEMLHEAETVFVAGFRRSFPVATYLAYMLGQAGKRTVLVDGLAGLQIQQVGGLGAGDVMLAISFSPYSHETLNLVETAKDRCPVIAITDSERRESDPSGARVRSARLSLACRIDVPGPVARHWCGCPP
jgi:DNA-binding MurR/RpiR family transcriptional regulator